MRKIALATALCFLFLAQGALAQQTAQWDGNLYWNASADASGYNLHKGMAPGGPYVKINGSLIIGLTFTDPAWADGECYVASAVGVNGLESGFSNEVCIVAPDPPGFLRLFQIIVDFLKRIFDLIFGKA